MQRDIAVAFEGGGAKLIGLIAAAHALYDLEHNDRLLKVTAASGTSAGSVAAFLLAAKADFTKIGGAIRKAEEFIEANFPPFTRTSLYSGIARFLFCGRTLYSGNKFEELISKILREIGIDANKSIERYVTDKKAFLMYSDIYLAKSLPADPKEIIRVAIRRSCSIPVVFSTYTDVEVGQRSDGGLLNNLPTDILQEKVNGQPIFAISFKPESEKVAKTSLQYISTLVSSSIRHRVALSKEAVGEDKVLDLDSHLKTLDFDKIVCQGLDVEYEQVRKQTRAFFESHIRGRVAQTDPHSERKGRAPLNKLLRTEKAIINYVEDSMRKAICKNDYLVMRVNAFSLEMPNYPDEITIEQLISFPEGDYVKGLILPLTSGAGYAASVECFVVADSPEGKPMPFEQFIIPYACQVQSGEIKEFDSAVLLFKGDLKKLIGKKIYVIKKERRYGFMSDLQEKRNDYLAVRSHFWPANYVSIQLNIPSNFPDLSCEWTHEGNSALRSVEVKPTQNTIPPLFKPYMAAISGLELRTRLKGTFSF